jgi:hypothetical protein
MNVHPLQMVFVTIDPWPFMVLDISSYQVWQVPFCQETRSSRLGAPQSHLKINIRTRFGPQDPLLCTNHFLTDTRCLASKQAVHIPNKTPEVDSFFSCTQ